MEYKEYKTFDQINKDLEIYKIEKDLAYYRFKKELDETKESLEIKNLLGDTPKKAMGFLNMLSGPLKSAALTFLFKKIF
ncbi:DUF6327 family protein [Flavobacterium coralii]|uniref:DUF6327 family protein n=1 Tax=Flavobacterium coralii TaxID=2838017 RepID=UPI000C43B693|nr:DUF6327 family protein [Flavobacterium coralii]MBF00376.1 hypothetical protein [Flavobacterium sp.]MBY8963354.1 hypothetical protein [Flavobacterium coralii]|tara:strand:+ start:674 stop:910 length:237 start_codon:yes stop_codon:yes gene_type:complete